jgi:hypothetical protein
MPFELNYAYMLRMIKNIPLDPLAPPGVHMFAEQVHYNIKAAHDAIIESHTFQHHHTNKQRHDDPEIHKNDLMYLSTKNLSLPKGRASKLLPQFISPYSKGQPDNLQLYARATPRTHQLKNSPSIPCEPAMATQTQ